MSGAWGPGPGARDCQRTIVFPSPQVPGPLPLSERPLIRRIARHLLDEVNAQDVGRCPNTAQQLLGILFESEAEFSADAEKQRAALQAILADPAKGKIFVAREGREVVAMASLLYTVSTAEGGKAALFEDLVTAPEHRKRGIGEALLKHVVAQARAEGVLRITLLTDMQNERAQAMYRRVGFVGSPMKPMRLRLRKKI